MKKPVLGNSILFLTAFVWGIAFAFQKDGGTIGAASFSSARCAITATVMGIVVLIKDRIEFKKGISPKQTKSEEEYKAYKKYCLKACIYCGIFFTLGNLIQQYGLLLGTDAGKAGFITALYVILVPIINLIVFKKRPRAIQWLSVVIGVVGLYLISVKEGFKIEPSDGIIMLCALCFSCQMVSLDHFVAGADAIRIAFMQQFICFVISVPLALIFESPSFELFRANIISILYCGLVSGCIGYSGQIIGQKYTDPTVASLILGLESVFGALGGWLILHEHMESRELLGCAIMFLAVILVQIPIGKRRH